MKIVRKVKIHQGWIILMVQKKFTQLIILKSQKIQTHEKNKNRLPIPAWEKSQEIFRLTDDGNLFSAQ